MMRPPIEDADGHKLKQEKKAGAKEDLTDNDYLIFSLIPAILFIINKMAKPEPSHNRQHGRCFLFFSTAHCLEKIHNSKSIKTKIPHPHRRSEV